MIPLSESNCGIRYKARATGSFRCIRRTGRRYPRCAGRRNPARTWCSRPHTAPGKSRTGAPAPPGNRRGAEPGRTYGYPSDGPGSPPRSVQDLDSIATSNRNDRRLRGAATWFRPLYTFLRPTIGARLNAAPKPGGPRRYRRGSGPTGPPGRGSAVPPSGA